MQWLQIRVNTPSPSETESHGCAEREGISSAAPGICGSQMSLPSPPSSHLLELGVPVPGAAQRPEVLCHPLNFESDGSREILELTKLSTTAARHGPTQGCRGGYMFPKKGKVNLYGTGTPAGSTAVVGTHRVLASLRHVGEEIGGREKAHSNGHIFHFQCLFPTPPPSPQNSSQVTGRNFSKTRCVQMGSLEQIKGSTCWAAGTTACSHLLLIFK